MCSGRVQLRWHVQGQTHMEKKGSDADQMGRHGVQCPGDGKHRSKTQKTHGNCRPPPRGLVADPCSSSIDLQGGWENDDHCTRQTQGSHRQAPPHGAWWHSFFIRKNRAEGRQKAEEGKEALPSMSMIGHRFAFILRRSMAQQQRSPAQC